jgi:hypothetical protein
MKSHTAAQPSEFGGESDGSSISYVVDFLDERSTVVEQWHAVAKDVDAMLELLNGFCPPKRAVRLLFRDATALVTAELKSDG